mgnify:CR=1 FL=1|jgi:hypothetical protein
MLYTELDCEQNEMRYQLDHTHINEAKQAMYYDGLLAIISFSLFQIMEKLTYLETLEVERQEKINAKKKALLQDNQRQKRLRYLPRIAEKIILIVFLSGMYFLIYAV